MGSSSINNPSINKVQWLNMPRSHCCFEKVFKVMSKMSLDVLKHVIWLATETMTGRKEINIHWESSICQTYQ